jgi:hypothetical protein
MAAAAASATAGTSIEALMINFMTCCHPGVDQLCHRTEFTSWVADTLDPAPAQ